MTLTLLCFPLCSVPSISGADIPMRPPQFNIPRPSDESDSNNDHDDSGAMESSVHTTRSDTDEDDSDNQEEILHRTLDELQLTDNVSSKVMILY